MAKWDLRQASPELALRWQESGLWSDMTFPELADHGLQTCSDARFRVLSETRPYDGTIGEVADEGLRIASALRARGVEAGDVVAFQLPTWAEAASCFYGLLKLGAVLVPIVHIYGWQEVGHILRESGAKALVTADRFGRQDFLANLDAVIDSLPDLEHVVVVDTGPELEPVPRRSWSRWKDDVSGNDPISDTPIVSPDDPVVIGFTSGTTAAPKGAIHTHRTLLADMRSYPALMATDTSPPVATQGGISGAPLAHITGLLVVLGPLLTGTPLHLIDKWDPDLVLRTMVADNLGGGGGATFFLTSLLDHPDFDPDVHVPLMKKLTLGGSPIPAEVARRARDLGILITRAYGCTEHPSISMCVGSDPEEKRLYTDGRIMPGVEVRIVDEGEQDLPNGQPGEILSRGPDLFVGYTDPELNHAAFADGGWYRSGDIGILDDQGFLTITDRKKDVIIRGGENVSAAEVENAIQGLAGVSEVAVVAAPHPRYGEVGCAFVHLVEGTPEFDLKTMQHHLEASGLARQKWPEELRFVEDFPRTASGKIQKHVLRAGLREPLPR